MIYLRIIAALFVFVFVLGIIYLLSLPTPANALGYPVPQEKPCKVYWDSKLWHERIANDPNTVAYLTSSHEIIAKHKKGFGVLVTHDQKGCLVITHLTPSQVEKLLTDQGDA